jgi:outer membrane protein OmpA-like peptidoglycan-associated protein
VVVAGVLVAAVVVPAQAWAWADTALQARIVDLVATVRDQRSRVQTTETRTARTVAVPSDVLFAFDSARVGAAGVRSLRAVARSLPDRPVRVTGHTDARGGRAYNDALSLRRARAVARVLRAARPGLRIGVAGAGQRRPLASNRTGAGRARNRRVEITTAR